MSSDEFDSHEEYEEYSLLGEDERAAQLEKDKNKIAVWVDHIVILSAWTLRIDRLDLATSTPARCPIPRRRLGTSQPISI